jgi:hypothetical protein
MLLSGERYSHSRAFLVLASNWKWWTMPSASNACPPSLLRCIHTAWPCAFILIFSHLAMLVFAAAIAYVFRVVLFFVCFVSCYKQLENLLREGFSSQERCSCFVGISHTCCYARNNPKTHRITDSNWMSRYSLVSNLFYEWEESTKYLLRVGNISHIRMDSNQKPDRASCQLFFYKTHYRMESTHSWFLRYTTNWFKKNSSSRKSGRYSLGLVRTMASASGQKKKLVFLGTPEVAALSLKTILEASRKPGRRCDEVNVFHACVCARACS